MERREASSARCRLTVDSRDILRRLQADAPPALAAWIDAHAAQVKRAIASSAPAPKLHICPITQREAFAFIAETHRHLPAPVGDVIRVGLRNDAGLLVGVAVAGRPSARALQDGVTLEITRVAVKLDVPNACSLLYGAIRRAALALGWTRIFTYTLPEEGGASLRASGWREVGTTGTSDREWNSPSRPRKAAARPEPKTRWQYP